MTEKIKKLIYAYRIEFENEIGNEIMDIFEEIGEEHPLWREAPLLSDMIAEADYYFKIDKNRIIANKIIDDIIVIINKKEEKDD